MVLTIGPLQRIFLSAHRLRCIINWIGPSKTQGASAQLSQPGCPARDSMPDTLDLAARRAISYAGIEPVCLDEIAQRDPCCL
jgi:hypothetical protein